MLARQPQRLAHAALGRRRPIGQVVEADGVHTPIVLMSSSADSIRRPSCMRAKYVELAV